MQLEEVHRERTKVSSLVDLGGPEERVQQEAGDQEGRARLEGYLVAVGHRRRVVQVQYRALGGEVALDRSPEAGLLLRTVASWGSLDRVEALRGRQQEEIGRAHV